MLWQCGPQIPSMAQQVYKPMARRLTSSQLERACDEFRRLVQLGNQDVRVMVVTDLPAAHWENTSVDTQCGKFEVTYSADGASVDVEMVDVVSREHEELVSKITRPLTVWAEAQGIGESIGIHGGGDTVLRLPDLIITRQPDGMVCPETSLAHGDQHRCPRLIIQVELHHRSVHVAIEVCREYFDALPLLQAVLILKVNKRRPDQSIACLALLFLREPCGRGSPVVLSDAVSFGSADIERSQCDEVESCFDDEDHEIRRLEPPRRMRMNMPSPWTADTITIPTASLLYATQYPEDVHPEAFEFDVWELYKKIDRVL